MSTKWLISANHNKYDHESAFEKWQFIDWKQGNYSYGLGDIIYIYSTAPYKTIRYKTEIIEIDKTSDDIVDDSMFWKDKEKYKLSLDGKYMRLKLLDTYYLKSLDLEELMKNGLNGAPQGPQKINEVLERYLETISNHNLLYPEVICDSKFYEGAKKSIYVNSYERNSKAREECIAYHGFNCKVCGINFEDEYGSIGVGFIHVHHIVPLSEIKKEYILNPQKDLIPVCPNCHAMIPFNNDCITNIYQYPTIFYHNLIELAYNVYFFIKIPFL